MKQKKEGMSVERKKKKNFLLLFPLFFSLSHSPNHPARGPRGLPLEVGGPARADRGHKLQGLPPRRGGPGGGATAAQRGGEGVCGEPVAEEEVEDGEPSLPGGAGQRDDLFDQEDLGLMGERLWNGGHNSECQG